MDKRGMILGHARSGSSELSRAIEDATGQGFRMEPFHKSMKKRGVEFDSPEFTKYLDEVMTTGPMFMKHMWNGITEVQNEAIISHPNIHGIVFIYRRDTVQAALSAAVARITKSWRINSGPIPSPLPLDSIEKQSRIYAKGQESRWNQVVSTGLPCMSLAYEDLYSDDDKRREDLLVEACATLGLTVQDIAPGVARIDPSNRYNSDEFYQTAPNWDDFKERFGR